MPEDSQSLTFLGGIINDKESLTHSVWECKYHVVYSKGKSAIAIARRFVGRQKNFTGQNFWAGGYYVSTVGRDEATIRKYIQEQEVEAQRLDQLELFKDK
jgi:REP element-mobilizing transposase RayT